MFKESHNSPIELSWGKKPHIAVNFLDQNGSECNLANSSAFGPAALRFGVVEQGSQMMHLSLRELEYILEPLRLFVKEGRQPAETRFNDLNSRECILLASKLHLDCLELGILTAPINLGQRLIIDNGLMILSREHLEELLPNINSFVAHGSIRPDLSEAWFGPRKRLEDD